MWAPLPGGRPHCVRLHRQLATQSILLDEGRPQYQAVTDDRQQFIFLLT